MLPFALLQTNAVILRSEPSSRTTLMGEQPNPWNVLPLQDVMSRHRGAEPSRRCELLEKTSLFTLLSGFI
jgi:hypothetical protein